MRILVLSDSHGAEYNMRTAIKEQLDKISMIIFLGDGERDLDDCGDIIGDIRTVKVRGNCDYGSITEIREIIEVRGKIIYCTHGFAEQVKYGDTVLAEKAENFNADIILYGHTHQTVNIYRDGRYFFNPGSLKDGDYGFIDITPSGIICVHRNLRD